MNFNKNEQSLNFSFCQLQIGSFKTQWTFAETAAICLTAVQLHKIDYR